ncbi:MAG: FAD-binding oxidoreductase [Candidatus Lumbricidophila eiseniae]|uniref:FAD-binding oxidoreductase n=1 Tax=Candidatus Lumbricidiphila eiseniae TaxID=1969409 RepID=A0A2A6FT73_9MICO|nr:MAG: FAD-binding oxidoreductase [Candidatus Lumbricidophila eiseniae]
MLVDRTLQVSELVAALRARVGGEVETGKRRRAEYSSDASNYRVVPEVVVFPRDVDDVIAVVDAARTAAVPLTSRGAGTSVAGNSIGPGIVIDYSRHLSRILEIDPAARTARVEPGVILGSLQAAVRPHGLRFGPDPSTWARCTIGGMIGNNACGSHSLVYGKTADNIHELDVLDGLGRRFRAGRGLGAVPGLSEFVAAHLAVIRTQTGRFGRQVSGYSLQHLLPERGQDLAKALVGTEGSAVAVLGATVALVQAPAHPLLVVLGYPDMYHAADAVPALLGFEPSAIEGFDARLGTSVKEKYGAAAVSQLPPGAGWLLVEVTGESELAAADRATKIVDAADAVSARIITDPVAARAIWKIREDGAGLAGRTASGTQTWPGFEDAAVPPEQLGAYLRDFDTVLDNYGLQGMPYGHFGDGCVHIRLDIPLEHDGSVLRELMFDAARLVARYGGSISGEHGDGRARSELLPLMYSPDAIRSFARFKALFDPHNLLNPGVIVAPAALDIDLRRPVALPLPAATGFAFAHDRGDFTTAVHRCVGVGACRADNTVEGGFMCPSYSATKDERDSTRGRARVLQEMANGTLVAGWRAPEVADALDLCLSCKACLSDCPAGVDMAQLKSEVLHRKYAGRLRPITHYILGALPRWARLVSRISPLVNGILRIRVLEKCVLAAGGIDTRRSVPRLARTPFRRAQRRGAAPTGGSGRVARVDRGAHASPAPTGGLQRVVLWVDSFSDNFSPTIAEAAVTVLSAAGFEVIFPDRSVCCALTWITTGQLGVARRKLSVLVDGLHPFAAAGIPIVGLEPSCIAAVRSDLRDLLPEDPRAAKVAAGTHTLAELLTTASFSTSEGLLPADLLAGEVVVVQPHCHQHAVMGFSADAQLLADLGAEITQLSGCCGLAGNFGMERGHYEVSVAVAQQSLIPALAAAPVGATFLADGFSCRIQAEQLCGAQGRHLAEILAGRLVASSRCPG